MSLRKRAQESPSQYYILFVLLRPLQSISVRGKGYLTWARDKLSVVGYTFRVVERTFFVCLLKETHSEKEVVVDERHYSSD